MHVKESEYVCLPFRNIGVDGIVPIIRRLAERQQQLESV